MGNLLCKGEHNEQVAAKFSPRDTTPWFKARAKKTRIGINTPYLMRKDQRMQQHQAPQQHSTPYTTATPLPVNFQLNLPFVGRLSLLLVGALHRYGFIYRREALPSLLSSVDLIPLAYSRTRCNDNKGDGNKAKREARREGAEGRRVTKYVAPTYVSLTK